MEREIEGRRKKGKRGQNMAMEVFCRFAISISLFHWSLRCSDSWTMNEKGE